MLWSSLAPSSFVGAKGRSFVPGPQNVDGAARIVAHDVERVVSDMDADQGNRGFGCLRNGVLLVFGAPCQLRGWRGRSAAELSH